MVAEMPLKPLTTNRVLVVDDDALLIGEYLKCLGADFEPDAATTTLGDLEKVLFGESTDERGAAVFDVQSRTQGEAAVDAVADAVRMGNPFAIVFLDIRMPPGIDGIEAAKRIRKIDPNINIVLVTGSLSPEPENLGSEIPPADKVFFFKKPFHTVECRQLAAALCGKWHSDRALRRANEILEQRVADRTRELRTLAYFDPVTGLPNRLSLTMELQVMMDEDRVRERRTAIVLIDIDRFSFLNETIGYDSGTELIVAIGRRLVQVLADEYGIANAIVGRFGADEFACVLPGMESDKQSQEMAEAIKSTVEEPFLIEARDIYLKAAVGVASYPDHGSDANQVFRCAESALHRSMRRIDNTIVYYHGAMKARAKDKFNLQAELRHAIECGEIISYYQPQIALPSGRLAGAEALARWTRPDGSIVPPSSFVPLSEEMGISDLLFEGVMRHVLETLSRWQDAGGWDVPISVNLSAHQLRNNNLVGLVQSMITEQNMRKSLLNLELTENVLLEDLTLARPVLDGLSELGVGIHIDDFGTGYSSLSYLAELPVQTLKIDQSFIRKLTESSTNERIVQAIIALGKAMELDVVAEGVETREQLDLVSRFGADLAQGFLISEPLPEEDFIRWCHARQRSRSLKRRRARSGGKR